MQGIFAEFGPFSYKSSCLTYLMPSYSTFVQGRSKNKQKQQKKCCQNQITSIGEGKSEVLYRHFLIYTANMGTHKKNAESKNHIHQGY